MSDPSLQEILKETIQLCRELNDVMKGLNARIGSLEQRMAEMESHHHKLPDTQMTGSFVNIGASTGLPLYPAGEREG